MKVKELIKLLSKYDKERIILVSGAYASEGWIEGIIEYKGELYIDSDICSG